MNTPIIMVVIFIFGLCIGWLGNSWLANNRIGTGIIDTTAVAELNTQTSNTESANSTQTIISDAVPSAGIQDTGYTNSQIIPDQNTLGGSTAGNTTTGTSIITPSTLGTFNKLLAEAYYYDAVILYQEQEQRNTRSASRMKEILLDHLNKFKRNKTNSDFSELIDSYLSIYYDDIDVLLLLAEFNHTNGSYLEVVDVYLLAKTYAYTIADQHKVDNGFNRFVENVDSSYTDQKNWWSLINFYSHIDTSGLMSSAHQYNQAVAYLRSGDEAFAVEQFNELLNDSVMGESAAIALNNLSNTSKVVSLSNIPGTESMDSISLQRRGNQYLVDLTNNDNGNVKLLIDTGASLTALSRSAFDLLNSNGDAIEQERRVFRTAGGVIMGTLFTFPELTLGQHLLKNTQVAVIDLDENRDIEGLLGMNILNQFRFRIDQDNSLLLLSRK